MERDIAQRIDGMMWAINASLDAVAACVRSNCSPEEARAFVHLVGKCMGENFEISKALYAQHPGIMPAAITPAPPVPKQS